MNFFRAARSQKRWLLNSGVFDWKKFERIWRICCEKVGNLIAAANRMDFIENVLNQNKILFAQKRDSLLRALEDRINEFMAR